MICFFLSVTAVVGAGAGGCRGGFQSQAAEAEFLGNGFTAFLAGGNRKRLCRIGDAEDRDAVRIQRGGLCDLRRDCYAVNVRNLCVESNVVTGLLRYLARETGVIGHIFQRTCDRVGPEGHTGLKISGGLAEEILRTGVRGNRQAG